MEKRLDEEQYRCSIYINEATQIPLAKAFGKVFIQSRLEFFQNEFGGLLEQHKDEDLARMYKVRDFIKSKFEYIDKKRMEIQYC